MLLRFINFLVYSNTWIGLGAAAFTGQFYLINDMPFNWYVISFGFFATTLTYTFQRYVKIKNDSKGGDRLEWMKRNPITVLSFMIVTTLGALWSLFYFEPESYIILPVLGILSLFYIVKIPGKMGRNLRDIPSLKIFLIGLVWAATSTLLPYYNALGINIELPWLLFLSNFIFIIGITIPFDIRDIDLDETEKKTIPQLFGPSKAIWIAIILLAINYFLLNYLTGELLPLTAIHLVLSILVIRATKVSSGDLYFAFLIDGFLISQALLIFLDCLILKGII